MARQLRVQCPCCATEIVIEAVSGKVVKHIRPTKSRKAKSLDDVMQSLEDKPQQQEAFFGEAMASESQRGDALEDAFRKAQERAAEKDPDEKPPSIYDLD